MGISNGLNQKIIIAIVAIIIIAGGALYYYGGYNYGAPNQPAISSTVTPNLQGVYPVSIKNFAFSSAVLNIKLGETISWTNNDSVAHTISGIGFQSDNLANGQTYSFTFSSTGTFDYICSIHPSMKGKIIVE